MDDGCRAVCMMCGRSPGYLDATKFVVAPGATVRIHGRRLLCDHCEGNIVFEPDDSLNQPDWVALTKRDATGGDALLRVARRRAIWR
jgi:hypothetical protein